MWPVLCDARQSGSEICRLVLCASSLAPAYHWQPASRVGRERNSTSFIVWCSGRGGFQAGTHGWCRGHRICTERWSVDQGFRVRQVPRSHLNGAAALCSSLAAAGNSNPAGCCQSVLSAGLQATTHAQSVSCGKLQDRTRSSCPARACLCLENALRKVRCRTQLLRRERRTETLDPGLALAAASRKPTVSTKP